MPLPPDSFYGRDSASIHEDETDRDQEVDALRTTVETDDHSEGSDIVIDTSPDPDGQTAGATFQDDPKDDESIPVAQPDLKADLPSHAFAEDETKPARPTKTVSLGSEGYPTGTESTEVRVTHTAASVAVAQAKAWQTDAAKEPERAGPEVRLQPVEAKEHDDESARLVERRESDSDSEWISLTANPAQISVKNGGREATLWQRGFRDKYRMAIAPLASPLRPPRTNKPRQGSCTGSVSSSVKSSIRASPAPTPEPPSSPRPLSVIRRLTSPRPSLGTGTLRARKSQRSLGTAAPGAIPKPSAAPSLAPPGASLADCGASVGNASHESAPIKNLH